MEDLADKLEDIRARITEAREMMYDLIRNQNFEAVRLALMPTLEAIYILDDLAFDERKARIEQRRRRLLEAKKSKKGDAQQ